MSINKELQVAVVGAGVFGTRYLRALVSQPGVAVSWICDISQEHCLDAARRFGIPRTSLDFAEVCRDPGVDVVVVVTPENAHRAATLAALEAGKHVIVEKPLATDEKDAQIMVDAARQSGRLLMTGFLLRFDYRYAQLKQRLPQIGPVRNIYAYRNFDRSLFMTTSRVHSFLENAVHDIDLILWYVGDRVRAVHGFCRNTLGLATPDVNWGILEFENGCMAVLQTSWLYPPQPADLLQWNAGIQVMGAKGVLEVANDLSGFRCNSEHEGTRYLDQTAWAEIHGEARGAFGAMLRHFLACARGRCTYSGTSPEQALETVRIARALIENANCRDPGRRSSAGRSPDAEGSSR